MKKVSFPIDKHKWSPSLIPGPLVLISTYGRDRKPNLAPKSWLQMVSFDPPMLMFSGTEGNTTENNIAETGCFGVNFADSSMAGKVFDCLRWYGEERVEKMGVKLVAAERIDAPLVDECRAHLECELDGTRKAGGGLVVFGRIVAASIWDRIESSGLEEKYSLLDQALFLENGLYAGLSRPARAGK